MRLPVRVRACITASFVGLVALVLTSTATASSTSHRMILFHSTERGTVRLQVAQGSGWDSDSSMNVMQYDDHIEPNQSFYVALGDANPCARVRSSSPDFPDTEWGATHLICFGRRSRDRVMSYEVGPR